MTNGTNSIRGKLFQVIFGVTLVFILLTTVFTNYSYMMNMSEVYNEQYINFMERTAETIARTKAVESGRPIDRVWMAKVLDTGMEVKNSFYLFDGQKQLIYTTDWQLEHEPSTVKAAVYAQLFKGRVIGSGKTYNGQVLRDTEGDLYKTMLSPSGWTLVLKVDKVAYYKKIGATLYWTLLFSLLCLGISYVIAKVMAEVLARPIIGLKEVFVAAATGDMAVRADENLSDEIGIAGQGFNYFMDRINQMTYQDTLTGLGNYAGFIRAIRQNQQIFETQGLALSEERPSSEAFQNSDLGVMVFGIDGFKSINDTFGFEAGDEVLKFTAFTMLTLTKGQVELFRLGGDEFGCLLTGVEAESTARQLIEQLNTIFVKGLTVRERKIYFTLTAGLCLNSRVQHHDGDLYKAAYLSLNRGKERQKGCLHVFDEGLQQIYIEKVEISMMLREAIERQELRLVLQPIFNTEKGLITSAEFLVRWHSSKLGAVPPDKFIPIAEENGMIIPIGAWILKEACKAIKNLQSQTGSRLYGTVNISSVQIADPHFMETLESALTESGLSPEHLVLEITEGLLLDDSSGVQNLLNRIKNLGCRLALDDFGTGYSSLSYLSKYPIDVIKIDRSFVMKMEQDSPSSKLVASIVQIARSMGMTVVAEGVETQEQLALLIELGCIFIQGYLISKPVELSEMAQLAGASKEEVVA